MRARGSSTNTPPIMSAAHDTLLPKKYTTLPHSCKTNINKTTNESKFKTPKFALNTLLLSTKLFDVVHSQVQSEAKIENSKSQKWELENPNFPSWKLSYSKLKRDVNQPSPSMQPSKLHSSGFSHLRQCRKIPSASS